MLGFNEVFDIFGGFVVHFVELRFESLTGQILVRDLVGLEEFFFGAVFDGNRRNEVGIIDVEDDKVCVATVGRDWEAVCLIGEFLPCALVDDHEDKVCWAFLDVDWKNVVFGVIKGGEGWGASGGGGGCGALTLARLICVTLLGGVVDLDVATDAL